MTAVLLLGAGAAAGASEAGAPQGPSCSGERQQKDSGTRDRGETGNDTKVKGITVRITGIDYDQMNEAQRAQYRQDIKQLLAMISGPKR